MPLIIPAGQNLSAEAFTSFAIGRQLTRIRDEQRRRQEEAADQGGAGIGGAAGTAAGIAAVALAAPTGGASLAALSLGASIGGGLGQIAGAAIDPPGSAVPGGQTGQIAGGINRISQGVLQFAAIEENKKLDEDQKDEAFLNNIRQTVGAPATQGFAEFRTAGLERGQSRSQVRQSFVEQRANDFAQVRKERAKGLAGAARLGKLEAKKIDAYMANPTQFRELFEVDKFNEQGFEDLRTSHEKIGQDFRAGKITDQGRQLARRAWRSRRDNFLGEQTLRQPPPGTVADYAASNQPLPVGVPVPLFKGSKQAILSTGKSSRVVPIAQTEGTDFGAQFTETSGGDRIFSGFRYRNGLNVTQGQIHVNPEDPDSGRIFYNKNGEPEFHTPKGGDDLESDITAIATKLLAGGTTTPAQASSDAEKVVFGARAAAGRMREAATRSTLNKKLEAARSLDGFLGVLSEGNAPLRNAVQVLQNRERVDRQSILDAIAEVARALNAVDSTERPGSEVIAGRADQMRGILNRINLAIEEQDRRTISLRQP